MKMEESPASKTASELPCENHLGNLKLLRQNLLLSAKAERILKDYKGIECKTCSRHFGYQKRLDGDVYFCSSPCLAVSETENIECVPQGIDRAKNKQCHNILESPCGNTFQEQKRGLSDEDREVAAIMKTKGESTTRLNGIPNAMSEYDSTVPSNSSFKQSENSGGGGGPNIVRSAGLKLSEVDQNESIEKWRNKEANETGSKLESEDLPSVEESVVSVESDNCPLRGNKDMIAAARKKSKSPPAQSTAKASALIRPLKGNNGKTSESTRESSNPKVKPLGNGQGELKKPKLWVIGSLNPSSSFKNKAGCFVAFVWSPVRFTLNATADAEAGKHDELYIAMGKYCGEAPTIQRMPSIGEIVFAPYNQEFYRAVVEQVLTETKFVRVSFIDYGDSSCIPLADCRDPCDEIMKKYPVYGLTFECLTKTECPLDAKLPEKLAGKLQDQVFMEGKPLSNKPFEWEGILYMDETFSKKFNAYLDKWLSTMNLTIASPDTTSKHSCAASDVSAKKASTDSQNKSGGGISMSSSQVLTRLNPFSGSAPTSQTKRTLLNANISPKLQHGAQVRVNYMWDYKTLTLSASEDDGNFAALEMLIESHVKTAPRLNRPVEVNDVVIAPYLDKYYRGVITSLVDSSAQVRFLDYGDETNVPISELVELSPEIDKHPIYGVIVKMDGVPDEFPLMDIPDMDTVMDAGGQLEVVDDSDKTGLWTGVLWVGCDRNWNDMILQTLGAVVKG